MKGLLMVPIVAALAACTSTPDAPPALPPVMVSPILCAAPVGMTAAEAPPVRPEGDYTQRDVALYVEGLHRWGHRGWLRLARVREHAAECLQDIGDDEKD